MKDRRVSFPPARRLRTTSRLHRTIAVAALAAFIAVLGGVPAGADVERSASYAGPAYGPGLRHTPTATKPQSKIWWHDGAWWALLYGEDGAVRINELAPDHTWHPTGAALVTSTPESVGDALADGDALHVLMRTRTGLVLTNLSYNGKRRSYTRDAGFPVLVAKAGSDSASLAKDTRGRLWTSFVTNGAIRVTHSSKSGRTWVKPYVPDVPGTALRHGEISEIVAMDGAIGVMWSDQRVGAFRLALHTDTAPDASWRFETAAHGTALADDHINAHVVVKKGGSTLLAAVKTSNGDHGEPASAPLIMVLERTPDGRWSRHVVGTVGDQQTRPLLAVDTADNVYVIGKVSADLVYKVAPLKALDFPVGPGTRLMSSKGSSFTDPTGTTQTLDSRTGIVALVTDSNEHRYWHAELAIKAPVDRSVKEDRDTTAPTTPTKVGSQVLDGAVRLSWSPSTDGKHWTPASDAVSVGEYRVFRDGVQVGTSTSTTFTDSPGGARSYTYTVQAVDVSGNRSESSAAVRVAVTKAADAGPSLPSVPSVPRQMLISGVLVLAVALLLVWRPARSVLRRAPRRARSGLGRAARTVPIAPAPQGKHARKPSR